MPINKPVVHLTVRQWQLLFEPYQSEKVVNWNMVFWEFSDGTITTKYPKDEQPAKTWYSQSYVNDDVIIEVYDLYDFDILDIVHKQPYNDEPYYQRSLSDIKEVANEYGTKVIVREINGAFEDFIVEPRRTANE